MKGPENRIKFDLRRVWECPVCHRRESTGGDIVHRMCTGAARTEPPHQAWMRPIDPEPVVAPVPPVLAPPADVAPPPAADSISSTTDPQHPADPENSRPEPPDPSPAPSGSSDQPHSP